MRKIAAAKDLPYRVVQRDIAAILYLIGHTSKTANVHFRASKILKELRKKEDFELSKVGNLYPPETLARNRRDIWKKIMKLRSGDPEKWNWFKNKYPKHCGVLKSFYQLDDSRGQKKTTRQIGSGLGISQQAVSQKKAIALRYLLSKE